MRMAETVVEIVDQLAAAGIATTAEPISLELPGALVLPGAIDFAYLDEDTFDMTFEIYLVTRNHRTQAEILNDLQDLLTQFRSVYPAKEVQPISLPAATGSPIPGLLINLTATITKD